MFVKGIKNVEKKIYTLSHSFNLLSLNPVLVTVGKYSDWS